VQAEALLDRLPHRPPFRFLSEVVELEPGRAGQALWVVRGDEPFFQGHFPGDPVVPGVLIAEALAQLSGLVGLHREPTNGPAPRGRLAHTDLRFDAGVVPPAEIRLRSSLVRSLGSLVQFEVSASVGERPVARGSLALARTDDEAGGGE
jgi:3-hydroxyacyl-[acyl-carrier-protein] dehydratase